MKKKLVAIIALLTVSIMSAQSKNDLLKEFQNLEEKLVEVSFKYDKKLQNFYKKEGGEQVVISESITEGNFTDEDFKDFGKEDKNFSKDDNMKETMKAFVETYDDNAKNKNAMGVEFEKENPSNEDKEFMKVMKEYDAEMSKIEKKMYEVAKKYLAKK